MIYADCWKGYQRLQYYDYTHEKVNHSISFADSDSGVHTSTIEDTLVQIRIKHDSFHRHFSKKQYMNSDCLGSLQSACSFH